MPFQVHARAHCARARALDIVAAPIRAMSALQRTSLIVRRASTKERLPEDCGKATKDERVFDMEHFLPADPVIPIQPPKPLATEPEQRVGTRMADHKRLPHLQRSKAFWEMDKGKSDMGEFMSKEFKGRLCEIFKEAQFLEWPARQCAQYLGHCQAASSNTGYTSRVGKPTTVSTGIDLYINVYVHTKRQCNRTQRLRMFTERKSDRKDKSDQLK